MIVRGRVEAVQRGVLQTGEASVGVGGWGDYLRSTGDIRRLAILSWLQANHLRRGGESARLSYDPRFTFTVALPSFFERGQNAASENGIRSNPQGDLN